MDLISSGFLYEFFFKFLCVFVHGGDGCVVVVDLPSWWWWIFL